MTEPQRCVLRAIVIGSPATTALTPDSANQVISGLESWFIFRGVGLEPRRANRARERRSVSDVGEGAPPPPAKQAVVLVEADWPKREPWPLRPRSWRESPGLYSERHRRPPEVLPTPGWEKCVRNVKASPKAGFLYIGLDECLSNFLARRRGVAGCGSHGVECGGRGRIEPHAPADATRSTREEARG